MINDRQITISVGSSRAAMDWQPATMLLSAFYSKLQSPVRGSETHAQYMAMSKPQQAALKDVGGFVGGTLAGRRRKGNAVTGRDLVTLDFDAVPAGQTGAFCARVASLGCGYAIYSTRKHAEDAPRLRVILPLDRTATAEEYEAIARKAAEMIGIGSADPTTFEASRLMYWPSCSADSGYIFYADDKPLLSADGMLGLYADWHDMAAWPQAPGAAALPKRMAAKQGDPETKPGIVGAFCRTYTITEAMDTFLPGVYEPVDDAGGRFTFVGGSTTGGAVLYDGGKFLFSHHQSDPCGGLLVNAFDLVRLHLFADQDETAVPGTPVNRLPSYKAMCDRALQSAGVKQTLAEGRAQQLAEAFSTLPAADGSAQEAPDAGWMHMLACHSKTGLPLPTIDNVSIILEHDPNLKGKFALNEFAGRGEVLGAVPWNRKATRSRLWEDSDSAGLYWYVEKYYHISANGKVDSALALHSAQHSFNNVTAYLGGLAWDGTPRLDTLFIDYLGAEDTPYNRAVTRKSLVAAVARAMTPGCKYDQMTILGGPQGIGKSTILDKLSRGWFNDSIRTFEGKEASELLQGVWIVEIAELQAFKGKADISRIKQFTSQRVDRFRAAYGRNVKELPRCCVFFGTTNDDDYLIDRTGNRRFWTIDVGVHPAAKRVWQELTDSEIDQLWAEAVAYWRANEPLYLSGELEETAKELQEDHRELSTKEGLIRDFVEKPVPADWASWDRSRRQAYWQSGAAGEILLAPRDRICALEIWCELLGGDIKQMKYSDAREINDVIAALPGWKRAKKAVRCGTYGVQKAMIPDVPSAVTVMCDRAVTGNA